MFSSSTYVSADDVADGGGGVVHGSSEERDERGVVHVDLVDLVEDLVDQTRIHHVLRLHRNHVLLHRQFHVRSSLDKMLVERGLTSHQTHYRSYRGRAGS